MSNYSENEVLLDVGFLVGYVEQAIAAKVISDEDEGLWYTVERLDELLVKGRLRDGQPAEEARKMLIKSVGELRGRLWHVPIPQAASDALNRLSEHFAKPFSWGDEPLDGMQAQEPVSLCLSDHQRQLLYTAPLEDGVDPCGPEIASLIGAAPEAVRAFWRNLIGDEPNDEAETAASVQPSPQVEPPTQKAAGRGTREWTAEQRAACAARTAEYHKNKPQLIPDDKLDEVRKDFEADVSFDRIGKKFGCSGGHVRNFLQKHGIDPRRGRKGPKPDGHDAEAVPPDISPSGGAASFPEEITAASIHDRLLPTPIDPAEWADIQGMLATGRSREAIAGDYEVPVAHLDAFIAARLEEMRDQHRQRKGVNFSPGESLALAPAGVGSAA